MIKLVNTLLLLVLYGGAYACNSGESNQNVNDETAPSIIENKEDSLNSLKNFDDEQKENQEQSEQTPSHIDDIEKIEFIDKCRDYFNLIET